MAGFLSSCAAADEDPTPPASTPASPAPQQSRTIVPSLTDPGLTATVSSHYAVTPSSNGRKGQLFVFIGGTFSRTDNSRGICDYAASLGYHAVNLAYPNDVPVTQCSTLVDADCAEKFRRELILGEAGSPLVTTNTTDALRNRLDKLLLYLTAQFPTEGWGDFLSGTTPVWSKLITSGHSQGAGHAAYFGLLYPLAGVAMFSGPQDFDYVNDTIAPWITKTKATAAANYYALLHLRDDGGNYAEQVATCRALGLLGTATNVDVTTAAPFGNSQILFTNATPATPSMGPVLAPFHNSTVIDAYTPRVNNVPTFQPVWRWMIARQ